MVCEQAEDSMHLRIGDIDPANPSRGTGIRAIVGGPPEEPEVRIVHISLPDGTTLLYSPASAFAPSGAVGTLVGALWGLVLVPGGKQPASRQPITVPSAVPIP